MVWFMVWGFTSDRANARMIIPWDRADSRVSDPRIFTARFRMVRCAFFVDSRHCLILKYSSTACCSDISVTGWEASLIFWSRSSLAFLLACGVSRSRGTEIFRIFPLIFTRSTSLYPPDGSCSIHDIFFTFFRFFMEGYTWLHMILPCVTLVKPYFMRKVTHGYAGYTFFILK